MTDSTRLRKACTELLQYLAYPARLRDNMLFEQLLQCGAVYSDCGLIGLVESNVAKLPSLHRNILSRCDLDRERHAAVARALGLSRRQFYRERAAALEALIAKLLDTPTRQALVEESAGENLDVPFAISRSLEEMGDWRMAADRLEHQCVSAGSQEERFWLETRLSEIYATMGLAAESMKHTASARLIGASCDSLSRSYGPISDVMEAALANSQEQANVASGLLLSAIPQLRARQLAGRSTRLSEVLLSGLLIRCELAHGEGSLVDAQQAASEAVALSKSLSSSSLVLAQKARVMDAVSQALVWREPHRLELELLSLYDEAVAAGFAGQSVMVAIHLSGFYRVSGQPHRSLDRLLRAFGAADQLGAGAIRDTFFVELAYTYCALGDLETAKRCVDGGASTQFDGLRALHQGMEAQLLLARRRYGEALELAKSAELSLGRLGRRRQIGEVLVRQAQALVGLGQRRKAKRVLRDIVNTPATGQLALACAKRLLYRM